MRNMKHKDTDENIDLIEPRLYSRRAQKTAKAIAGLDHWEKPHVSQGLEADVRGLLGTWVYIEGARMNYRGLLVDVYVNHDDEISAVGLEPAWRLGWWDTPEAGPKSGYHFKLKGRCVVPWEYIHALHEQFDNWPKA